MKQIWNLTSSEAELRPVLNVTSSLNATTRVTRVQTDINGIMNNQRMLDDAKMQASAAW